MEITIKIDTIIIKKVKKITPGEKAKYYVYKNTSGRINIPKSIANLLGWKNQDELMIEFRQEKGNSGLFIYKEE